MNAFSERWDAMRGKRVRAIKYTESGRVVYTGILEKIQYQQRHIILADASHADGTDAGTVMLAHTDAVELLHPDDDGPTIQSIPVEQCQQLPYQMRVFDPADNGNFISSLRADGTCKSFPVVYERDSDYIIADGNKRLWACTVGHIDTHPCEIREYDPLDAADTFAWSHYPMSGSRSEEYTDRYTGQQLEDSLKAMLQSLGSDIIEYSAPVSHNIEQCGIDAASVLDDG